MGDWVLQEVAHRGCGVPILRNTKKQPGHGPGKPVQSGPAWERGLDRMTSRGSLPTLTILCFFVQIHFILLLPKATAGFNLQLNAIPSFLIIFFPRHMKNMYLCSNPIPNAVYVLFFFKCCTVAIPCLKLDSVFKIISARCCCLVSCRASQKAEKALGPLLGNKLRNSTFWLKLPDFA